MKLTLCKLRFNKLTALFCAKEVLWLVCAIVILWCIATFAYVGKDLMQNHDSTTMRGFLASFFEVLGESIKHGFAVLFNASAAVEGRWVWAKTAIFFVVWLLGGGVMISAMVGQYNRIHDCEFRLWKWVLRGSDHIVFFGWNSEVMSYLRCLPKNRLVIILSSVDSRMIKTVLDDIPGLKKELCLIYRCEYDDSSEQKDNLKLNSAALKEVYIAGDERNAVNDSRNILLARKLSEIKCGPKKVYCAVNDFGLAQKMIESKSQEALKDKDKQDKALMKVSYTNFHQQWGDYLVEQIKEVKRPLYIIGFGAMGKAVALAALKDMTVVFVSDPDEEKLKQETKRFEQEFGKPDRMIVKLPWSKMKERLAADQEKTVVVAIRKSEKGMLVLTDFLREFGDCKQKNHYYLSQEVEGLQQSSDKQTNLPTIKLWNETEITLFGMNRGAPWKTEKPEDEKKA